MSFFDYDLDETDLYGDLLWEAPKDEEQVPASQRHGNRQHGR